MFAKSRTVAGAALAALAIVAASLPAVARDSQAPSYDSCYTLSVQRGSGPNMGGGTREHAQHKTFMDQCMSGKIVAGTQASPATAKPSAQARPAAAKLPADAYASTASPKRTSRQPAASAR
jgi:hypothetical protein